MDRRSGAAQRQFLDRNLRKSVSNREWVNLHVVDVRITAMKDGRTHLAYNAEHAVDLETGGCCRGGAAW